MAQMVKIMLNLLSCNKFGICCFCRSIVQSCLTICNPMDFSTPGLPVPHHQLKFVQVHAHCFSDAIQPSHPLIPLLLLPSIFPSIRDFSNESPVHIRWPKYWNFTFSISPFQWLFRIDFPKIDWFDILAVQGTLRSLLQHHNKGINSLALHLLYDTARTILCDHWEDHSFDYMDLCQQSNVSNFQHIV